jgi:hypothetical protein
MAARVSAYPPGFRSQWTLISQAREEPLTPAGVIRRSPGSRGQATLIAQAVPQNSIWATSVTLTAEPLSNTA